MLSGMTAFITLKEGTEEVSKSDMRKAFKPVGLKLERVTEREIVKPAETYQIKVQGGT
jgi:hypothetical protein